MKSLLLPGICTISWLLWIPATGLQKKVRGDDSGLSIVPVIPLFPLIAWLSSLGLDYIRPDLGFFMIGGIHVVLSVIFIGSSLISLFKLRGK